MGFCAGTAAGTTSGALPTLRAMVATPALQAHALELLSSLGPSRARRMFGGAGIYVGEHFIALVANDVLFLKADALARPAFVAAGCHPFSFATQGGQRSVLGYWSAPDEAMESPAQMRPWAVLALESALRAAAAKRCAVPRKAQASTRQARPARAGGKALANGRKTGA